MLQRLQIQNYLIIDKLTLDFSPQLTVITGETGAGKSILLGALSLALGERADTTVLLDNGKKCVVEGQLKLSGDKWKIFFNENELDFDETTLVRREISVAGKSRAFINDTPVNLNVLKNLMDANVDLHSQFETMELKDASFYYLLLDALSGQNESVKSFKLKYYSYKENLFALEELKSKQQQARKEQDYLQFQFNELEEIKLKAGEQEKLEREIAIQEHAEQIKMALQQSIMLLQDNDQSTRNQLRGIIQQLNSVLKFQPEFEKIIQRLESTRIELEDISSELEQLGEAAQYEPAVLEKNTARLDTVYRLQKKHGVKSIDELLQIQNQLEKRLQETESLDEEINALEKQVNQLRFELEKDAQETSAKRLAQIPGIEKKVNALLKNVGMPDAKIKMEHSNIELSENGIDKFRLLFSANKGVPLQEVRKAASGGELSRLMLCIQSLIAANAELPTLIFDEIDTGISGEAAQKVGKLLRQLSMNHQVICITHLPQIAGRGDMHYFVFKENENNRTMTRVKKLKPEERVVQIAKMLSGEKPGEAALQTARELIR